MFATLVPFLLFLTGLLPMLGSCILFALLFGDIFKLLPKLIEIAFELLDPFAFLKDLMYGIILGVEMIIRGVFDIIFGKLSENSEKIPGAKKGLFPNGILNGNKSQNTKCVKPSTIRLILMVLCPPFALFMKYGILRGWLWIIICFVLTYYFYYFPGLLFASMHTLCF